MPFARPCTAGGLLAIFAARSCALLFVRGVMVGGAVTTLGRALGLDAGGSGVVGAVTLTPLEGFKASALFERARGRAEDADEGGRAVDPLRDVREAERGKASGFRTRAADQTRAFTVASEGLTVERRRGCSLFLNSKGSTAIRTGRHYRRSRTRDRDRLASLVARDTLKGV